ncbi:MAG: hypothetical protein ACRDJU_06155 [Actinomycetota bacterium]
MPSQVSDDQSSVVVMSTARRPRPERVIDVRDDDPGPARWPADGWTLGSAASGWPGGDVEDMSIPADPAETWHAGSPRAAGTEVWQTPAAVSAAAARTGELRLRELAIRPNHTETRAEQPRLRAERPGMAGESAGGQHDPRQDPRMRPRTQSPQLRAERHDPRTGATRTPLPASDLARGTTRPAPRPAGRPAPSGTARQTGPSRAPSPPRIATAPAGNQASEAARPAPVLPEPAVRADPTSTTPWEARVAAREAQRAAARQAQQQAESEPMTPWEARVAARESREAAARQARQMAARQAVEAQRVSQLQASRALHLAPPATAHANQSAAAAAVSDWARPVASAMPAAVATGASGGVRRRSAPARAAQARPAEPEIPPIQRRIAERPRHAAISGPREPRTRRRTADSKWSVIDLTQPEPTMTQVPAPRSPLPAEAQPAAAVAAAQAPTSPIAPTSPVAPAAAGPAKPPAPKVLRLDPLSYFDRAAKADKVAKPGQAHKDHGESSRRRAGSDFTPYYRPVGELSYVAAPSGGRAGGR